MIGRLDKKDDKWFIDCISNVGCRYECYNPDELKAEHDKQHVEYRLRPGDRYGLTSHAEVTIHLSLEFIRDYKLSKLCS
jgi:hypothetical protein